MRRLMLFIPLLLSVLLIGVLWLGLGRDPYTQNSAVVGKTLPDLSGPDLFDEDRSIALHSLKGRPFLLNVWASWCANCRSEHDLLIALSQQVPVYGLNYRDKPASARAWLDDAGNPYTLVVNDQDGQIALSLGVYGTPETWLFSADGTVLARYTGVLTEEIWRRHFAGLLAPQETRP